MSLTRLTRFLTILVLFGLVLSPAAPASALQTDPPPAAALGPQNGPAPAVRAAAPPYTYRPAGLSPEKLDAAPTVLVFRSSMDTFITDALIALGLGYTAYIDDEAGFVSALTGGSWELVIFGKEW